MNKVELLACDCNDCTHWEVVRTYNGSVHLHCKTCERRDELDSFTISGSQVKWIITDRE